MESGLGCQLEEQGWRQGHLISFEKSKEILKNQSEIVGVEVCIDLLGSQQDPFYLVVVSQSCDIARNQLINVELAVCKPIPELGDLMRHARNPRTLHLTANFNPSEGDIYAQNLEIEIHKKLFISKACLANANVEWLGSIQHQDAQTFTRWLTGQYQRSAFPTAFNNRIHKARKKREKKAKKLSGDLYAIYAKVYPDEELSDTEQYNVELLGVVASQDEKIIKEAQERLDEFAGLMQDAGVAVKARALPNTNIPLSVIEDMQRLDDYDYLSYKNPDDPFLQEI